VHHTFTNIKGSDEDIDIAPGLIRLHDSDEWKPRYRYQHIYAFLLYGLSSLSWVLRKDFVKFFQPKIGNYNNTKRPTKELVTMIFFKALYIILFIALPLMVMEISVLQFIGGFLLMHFIQGWTLAFVFQPAHAVENVEFPLPNEKGIIPEEWAAHQLQTCSNFATKSKLATWFTGGLNYQIEHHLFPTICHIHYPQLAPIIRASAQKHNLPYFENETYYKAINSHYKLLKRMGTN
jgi:linoleoyl-CoA desaturase